MRKNTIMLRHAALILLASVVFPTAAISQQTSPPSEPGTNSRSAENRAAAGKSVYGGDDCRDDMQNADDAKRAGHITEKEYAEQRKMAQAKMERDSQHSGKAPKDKPACK